MADAVLLENTSTLPLFVDPVLKAGTPVFEYAPKTWGPSPFGTDVIPAGGWWNPEVVS